MNDDAEKSLYERLGGYDSIAAVANALVPRLMADPQLGRFWADRSADSTARELQHLISYLTDASGGQAYYFGRPMDAAHEGMGITASDWEIFLGHVRATLESFDLPEREFDDVYGFISGHKDEIVEA